MGTLFGTDGIRGPANQHPMTAEMAMRVGRAVATIFTSQKGNSKIWFNGIPDFRVMAEKGCLLLSKLMGTLKGLTAIRIFR